MNKNNKGKRSQHLHVESASAEGGFRVGIQVACNHLSSCLELLSGNEKGQGKTDFRIPGAYFTIPLVSPQLSLITVFNYVYFGVGREGRSLWRWPIGRVGK